MPTLIETSPNIVLDTSDIKRDAAPAMPWRLEMHPRAGGELMPWIVGNDGMTRMATTEEVQVWEYVQRLLAWKESATTLLPRYDAIAETFGGRLGSSKVDNLERGVADLRAELAAAKAQAPAHANAGGSGKGEKGGKR